MFSIIGDQMHSFTITMRVLPKIAPTTDPAITAPLSSLLLLEAGVLVVTSVTLYFSTLSESVGTIALL